MTRFFTAAASLACCSVQNLFVQNTDKQEIFGVGTTECIESIVRFAVEEKNLDSPLCKNERELLIANTSEIVYQLGCNLHFWEFRRNLRKTVHKFAAIKSEGKLEDPESIRKLWKGVADSVCTVSFANRRLGRIPLDELQFFPHVISLGLSDMGLADRNIRDIERLSFLSDLRTLRIRRNRLTSIPCFNQFRSLKYVNMSYCPITSLSVQNYTDYCSDPSGSIGRCNTIEVFSCSHSPVDSISEDFFCAFPNLRVLYLNSTRITDISMLDDAFFAKYKNITLIELQNCNITRFPDLISKRNRKKIAGVHWKQSESVYNF